MKIALSSARVGRVRRRPAGRRYRRTFTRAEFEALIAPLIDRSLAKCRSALQDAELTADQIDEVVLVGGSTRIPYVRRRVGEFFGRTPHTELNPDEVVALGAAVQADILTGGRRHMLLLDVVPLSLGHRDARRRRGQGDPPQHDRPGPGDDAIHARRPTGRRPSCINIYQGERELTKDCQLLGHVQAGRHPADAGRVCRRWT